MIEYNGVPLVEWDEKTQGQWPFPGCPMFWIDWSGLERPKMFTENEKKPNDAITIAELQKEICELRKIADEHRQWRVDLVHERQRAEETAKMYAERAGETEKLYEELQDKHTNVLQRFWKLEGERDALLEVVGMALGKEPKFEEVRIQTEKEASP